jgi:hypothetical protein
MLGYVDGLERPLKDLSADVSAALEGSYFERTWDELHSALRNMYSTYPEG